MSIISFTLESSRLWFKEETKLCTLCIHCRLQRVRSRGFSSLTVCKTKSGRPVLCFNSNSWYIELLLALIAGYKNACFVGSWKTYCHQSMTSQNADDEVFSQVFSSSLWWSKEIKEGSETLSEQLCFTVSLVELAGGNLIRLLYWKLWENQLRNNLKYFT